MQKSAFLWSVLFIGIFIPESYQAYINTTSVRVKGTENGDIILPCDVQNKGVNDTVVWQFVDHNVTLSTDRMIRIKDEPERYEVSSTVDCTGTCWYLQINKLQFSDIGAYKCYVSGPGADTSVVHHLSLQTEPPERGNAPAANIMDCCMRKNVSSCIYPLCDRGSYPFNEFVDVLNNDDCIDNYILDVLECGQGGRNALGCCIQSGIPEVCQNLCEGWGTQDGTNYEECIGIPALTVAICYDKAIAYLPSQPVSVSGISNGNGFIASWLPPLENADKVTRYRVKYRRKYTEHYDTVSTQNEAETSIEIDNLMADTVYEFAVIALAGTGASQPSYTVDVAVRGMMTPNMITETIYDCCIAKNISSNCTDYCNADTFERGGNPDKLLGCYAELDDLYSCLSFQGNHTPCCSRMNVPSACFPLCEGRVNLNWNVSLCLPNLNTISACILEGSILLPSPPFNTGIIPGSITDNSVSVAWNPPANFRDGDSFIVAWRMHTNGYVMDWNTASVVDSNSFTIQGLEPVTLYDVVVATSNSNGTSLPETTLEFVTEDIGFDNEVPYNETECCIDRGVLPNCIDICKHEFRLTDAAITVGIACQESVLPMLQCATDNRDHTACCVREGIPDECLDLCSLHPEEVPSTALIQCFLFKNNLSRCFDEGKGLLPNSPFGLTVKNIQEHSITLDWQRPSGPAVSVYTIQYCTETCLPSSSTWSGSVDSTETFKKVENLSPGMNYHFRVFSKNANGTSFPSEVVVANTLLVPLSGNVSYDWDALWQNRSDCCANSNISQNCQAGCNNGDLLSVDACIQDLDQIVACGADGKDHQECCGRLPNFPQACLPFCAGQVPPQDGSTAICLSYRSLIFSCFTEGQGRLPSPPKAFQVDSFTHNLIKVTWEQPEDNCDSQCLYKILLWQDVNSIQYFDVTGDSRSYTFSNLLSQTEYRISAIAANIYGSSLPAPYLVVTTAINPYTGVTVAQYPVGVINKGQGVQLECTTYGSVNSVKWIRKKKTVSQTNLYQINSLDNDDEGLYSCEATFPGNVKTSKDLFINVRYKPHAKSMTESPVLPGLGQEAVINCTFMGFPERMQWTKDSDPLTNVSKYLFESVQSDLQTGITLAVLRIRSVTNADFGSYSCTGINSFGEDTITGKLENLTPTAELPPNVNRTVSECCDQRGVSTLCASKICTYTLDLNAIIYDTSLLECLNYFEDYIACGTDGRDHSQCCDNKGVSEYCLDFCAGKLPQYVSSWDLIVCMGHVDDIGNCLVDGASYIPTIPRSLAARVEYDAVSVTWEKPDQNGDKVSKYDIYYQPNNGQYIIESVSPSITQYYLPVAEKGVTYTVWGRAVNDFGQSAETPKVQVAVNALTPRMPSMLDAQVIAAVNINVRWAEPSSTNVRITGYKVIYWRTYSGRNTAVSATVQNILRTRLVDLNPNTMYSIVVVARSADGYGQETDIKKVATGQVPEIATSAPKTQEDNSNVGVILGIVFAIIFLLAIGLVVVLFYRRSRGGLLKLSGPVADSVAFENPSYGNRSGLPGENADGNQFGYSNLKEEQDHEQVHLSIGNTSASSSTETPATLDLTS